MILASRYHDVSMGHRVVGQGGKCENLHGHNYRFTFTVMANELDGVGRVLDFGVIKSTLCRWLDEHWDHRFLVWVKDPWREQLTLIDDSVVWIDRNPTAENLALIMVEHIGPNLLANSGAQLVSCIVEETRKCSATYAVDL